MYKNAATATDSIRASAFRGTAVFCLAVLLGLISAESHASRHLGSHYPQAYFSRLFTSDAYIPSAGFRADTEFVPYYIKRLQKLSEAQRTALLQELREVRLDFQCRRIRQTHYGRTGRGEDLDDLLPRLRQGKHVLHGISINPVVIESILKQGILAPALRSVDSNAADWRQNRDNEVCVTDIANPFDPLSRYVNTLDRFIAVTEIRKPSQTKQHLTFVISPSQPVLADARRSRASDEVWLPSIPPADISDLIITKDTLTSPLESIMMIPVYHRDITRQHYWQNQYKGAMKTMLQLGGYKPELSPDWLTMRLAVQSDIKRYPERYEDIYQQIDLNRLKTMMGFSKHQADKLQEILGSPDRYPEYTGMSVENIVKQLGFSQGKDPDYKSGWGIYPYLLSSDPLLFFKSPELVQARLFEFLVSQRTMAKYITRQVQWRMGIADTEQLLVKEYLNFLGFRF